MVEVGANPKFYLYLLDRSFLFPVIFKSDGRLTENIILKFYLSIFFSNK